MSSYSSPAKLGQNFAPNQFYSYNWAGYAINASLDSVTQVKGSWIEPAITCPYTGIPQVGFWIGIDGLVSPTVEQTGTAAQCTNGVASYYAWYEFYPANVVTISGIVVSPGNVFSATVKYSTTTSKFTVRIKDVTTGKSFSHSAAVAGAQRSSAEWIAEAPATCTSYTCTVPLADFGTASIGKDSTHVTGTNTATISGSTKIISKFGTLVDAISMVNLADTVYKAQPSALSTDGTSFTVGWVSAGP